LHDETMRRNSGRVSEQPDQLRFAQFHTRSEGRERQVAGQPAFNQIPQMRPLPAGELPAFASGLRSVNAPRPAKVHGHAHRQRFGEQRTIRTAAPDFTQHFRKHRAQRIVVELTALSQGRRDKFIVEKGLMRECPDIEVQEDPPHSNAVDLVHANLRIRCEQHQQGGDCGIRGVGKEVSGLE
jgi:hypothetical protein